MRTRQLQAASAMQRTFDPDGLDEEPTVKLPHLFEFMDQPWLPDSLAATLREILSCGNAAPFRRYYSWVADKAVEIVRRHGSRHIVELGAGTAPITRELVRNPAVGDATLIVCDARPDRATYEALQKQYPDKIAARLEPVDFSLPHQWPKDTLLILSGTFHHIPDKDRRKVLTALTDSADVVVIAEPLRKTLSSVAFVFLSIVPAILLPLWYIRRPGRLRRVFWCWLLPVAPIMFWWDGLVSCIRMWRNREWLDNLGAVAPPERSPSVAHSLFCQMVAW